MKAILLSFDFDCFQIDFTLTDMFWLSSTRFLVDFVSRFQYCKDARGISINQKKEPLVQTP